jgi:hypothetical protein
MAWVRGLVFALAFAAGASDCAHSKPSPAFDDLDRNLPTCPKDRKTAAPVCRGPDGETWSQCAWNTTIERTEGFSHEAR